MANPMDSLIGRLANVPASERISMRDPILRFGSDCIEPLVRLAESTPDLGASVAAWLETLATQQPATLQAVCSGLGRVARTTGGDIARQALGRLAGGQRTAQPRKRAVTAHRGKSAACEAVHARLIEAAKQGHTVVYSDLKTSRGHIGKYLIEISREEAAASRPPLTSIVVSKSTGLPGDGYIPAMVEVGFAEPHESLRDVWQRAKAAVFEYWRDGIRT